MASISNSYATPWAHRSRSTSKATSPLEPKNKFYIIYFKKSQWIKNSGAQKQKGQEAGPFPTQYSFPEIYFMVVMSMLLVFRIVLNTTSFTVGGRDLASDYMWKLIMETERVFSPKWQRKPVPHKFKWDNWY